jgi:hypothetical protein
MLSIQFAGKMSNFVTLDYRNTKTRSNNMYRLFEKERFQLSEFCAGFVVNKTNVTLTTRRAARYHLNPFGTISVLWNVTQGLRFGRNFWNGLSNGKWT